MSSVILFGAGASYGAGAVVPNTPPLGLELYSELSRNFAGSWGVLPDDAKEQFKVNFERGMRVIWHKYSGMTMELMRHMSLYFGQFRPKQPGSTVYAALARELQQRRLEGRVTVATLNYECLLELEFWHAGIELSYSFEEVQRRQTKVLKPHGSCNFIPVGISGPVGSIKMGHGAAMDMPVRAIGDMNEVIKHILTQALPPVMCLYIEGKPTQVATGTVKAIQKILQDEISIAKAIAVVGVYPNPEDTHIWDSIASCQGQVGYVGPSAEAFTRWAEEYRPQAGGTALAETFKTGVVPLVSFIERSENASQ